MGHTARLFLIIIACVGLRGPSALSAPPPIQVQPSPTPHPLREQSRLAQDKVKAQYKPASPDLDSPNYKLGLAVEERDIADVRKQLAAGADINTLAYEGEPPLMIAAKRRYLELVILLLDRGARIEVRTKDFTFHAVEAAAQADKDNSAVLEHLIGRGGSPEGSDAPSQSQLARRANASLDKTPKSVDELDGDPTPLQLAVEKNQPENVETLIRKGANVNAFSGGRTALMQAAFALKASMVELLLSRGAAINLQTADRETALSLARSRMPTGSAGGESKSYRRTIELLTSQGGVDRAP